jgi:hypothetical protein
VERGPGAKAFLTPAEVVKEHKHKWLRHWIDSEGQMGVGLPELANRTSGTDFPAPGASVA